MVGIRYAKKQKNTIDNKEKNELRQIQLIQILELANEYIKTDSITDFWKTQIELVEMKTKVSVVKKFTRWINSPLNIANEMISELEDKK